MNNGTILVLGSKRANQFDPNVPCIFTLDGTGSLITSGHPDGNFTFGSEYDALVAMSKTPENKILVHGFENQDTGQGWVEYQMVSYRLNNEDSSIGIDEIKDSAMEIYPNPVTSSFRIDGTQVISVSVFDAQGSLVKQYAKSNSYDVNNLDAGMYTVVVSSNSGVRTIKMVKY
jgi:hypothetical protein